MLGRHFQAEQCPDILLSTDCLHKWKEECLDLQVLENASLDGNDTQHKSNSPIVRTTPGDSQNFEFLHLCSSGPVEVI